MWNSCIEDCLCKHILQANFEEFCRVSSWRISVCNIHNVALNEVDPSPIFQMDLKWSVFHSFQSGKFSKMLYSPSTGGDFGML